MDVNYYLNNTFVQLGVWIFCLLLCMCNIRMCYTIIKGWCTHAPTHAPTHAQKSAHAQSGPTHAQGTCPDPRTGPCRAITEWHDDEKVYDHIDSPGIKIPCKIYINDEGNLISHV